MKKLAGLILIFISSAVIWAAFRWNFTPLFNGIKDRIVLFSSQPQLDFILIGLGISSILWLLLKFGFSFNILDIKLPDIDTENHILFQLPIPVPIVIVVLSAILLIVSIGTPQTTLVSIYNISPGESSEHLVGNELVVGENKTFILVAKTGTREYAEIIDLECDWQWSGDPTEMITDGNCVVRLNLADDFHSDQIMTLTTNQRFQKSASITTVRFVTVEDN